jgi:hypothetical protein
MKFFQLATIAGLVSSTETINFKAWQSSKAYPEPNDFPELHEESVLSRPNTAIAFTGGGSRSFLASIGYLAGLNELGLIPNIRYISGISGGSWATLTFTYSQLVIPPPSLLLLHHHHLLCASQSSLIEMTFTGY